MNLAVQTYSVNINLQQTFRGQKTLLKTTTSKMELPGKASLQKTLALTALLGLSTLSMSALTNNYKNNSQTAQVESVQSKQNNNKDSIITAQQSSIEAKNKEITELKSEVDKWNKIEKQRQIIETQNQQIENLNKEDKSSEVPTKNSLSAFFECKKKTSEIPPEKMRLAILSTLLVSIVGIVGSIVGIGFLAFVTKKMLDSTNDNKQKERCFM